MASQYGLSGQGDLTKVYIYIHVYIHTYMNILVVYSLSVQG
jgi:hypothetical protein